MENRDPSLKNYDFLGTIGTGGMGVVYKARHVILNTPVAIKTLHSHLTSAASFRRFQTEGQATSSLDHPNIVKIHDFGMTQDGRAFMIMDFIDGETLGDVLSREGQLPLQRFLNIFIQVSDALAHAHGRSVVHRDIKSSNIMILKDQKGSDEIRIMDFGIAKLLSDTASGANSVTQTGEVVGSVTCMSPEQARGGKVDERSDLYSLGCVMYEALTTSPPFEGNTPLETMLMHLEKKPPSIKEASLGNQVDDQLEKIVLRLLEKDPNDRYQSMTELKQDLLELQSPASYRSTNKDWAGPGNKNKSGKAHAHPIGASRSKQAIFIWLALISFAALTLVTFIYLKPAKKPPAKEDSRPADVVAMDTGYYASRSPKQIIEEQVVRRNERVSTELLELLVTDSDLDGLADASPDLKNVMLRNDTNITDKGLQNLKNLDLDKLDISNTKARDLDWITGMQNLKELEVSEDVLSKKAFKNIGVLKGLENLNLKYSNVSDEDIATISKLSKLKRIDITHTNISLDGLDHLMNNLPDCDNINWIPVTDNRGHKWLNVIPVETRSSEDLLAKAKEHYNKQEWKEAHKGFVDVILKARTQESPAARYQQMSCESNDGDCLLHLNLPFAAVHMYRKSCGHITLYGLGESLKAHMLAKEAAVYESLRDKTYLPKAIRARQEAGLCFEEAAPAPSVKEDWSIAGAHNLQQLGIDERAIARQNSTKD